MSTGLLVFLALFVLLLVLGFHVAWSLVAASLAWFAVQGNWAMLPVVPERIFQGMDVFVLMAVPLFILAGELVSVGRITDRLIHFAMVAFGWLRGGLAQVNIGASILFAGITGVALGDIAALGRILIPAMVERGYSSAYAAAVTASSSIIGPMVPPSLIIVIYGSMTNISIGGLFAAAILPGILIGLVQMALVAVQARVRGYAPIPMERGPRIFLSAGLGAAVPLTIPLIILAGILGGVMTPTEAGGVAAFYALLLGVLAYRTIKLAALPALFGRAAVLSGQLVIIVGCGAVFSWVMAMENVPRQLSSLVETLDLSLAAALVLINLFLFFVGMLIDPSAAIVMFGPILAPVAIGLGMDPLHFGVVMVLNLNIGLLTPPLGVCLFAAERLAGCGLGPLLRETAPFLLVNLVGLGIVVAVPGLSLWLPRLVGF